MPDGKSGPLPKILTVGQGAERSGIACGCRSRTVRCAIPTMWLGGMAPVLDIWNREGAADVSTSDSTIILLIGELGTQHSRTVPDHL
jgi:hypothetical protein